MRTNQYNRKLKASLVLDELYDLSLYKTFRQLTSGALATMLDELIVVETKHFHFWNDFFHSDIRTLDLFRRVRLRFIVFVCRMFGEKAIYLTLEAIELHGIKKYLGVWEQYKDESLGGAVRQILEDEFQHEDSIVSGAIEKKINAEKIRNVFLGFNDGLVEILGAVSGFFAAFQSVVAVLAAGTTVAVAGALSMAAGAYVAVSSEKEIETIEIGKKKFLEGKEIQQEGERPFISAIIVGISYIIGALVPLLPAFFGSKNIFWSVAASVVMIIVISVILAFLSGMDTKRRVLINLVIIAFAVVVTYAIGLVTKAVFAITI